MDNPWFILIVFVPVYIILALIVAAIGAAAAPWLGRPRSRFFVGFGFSLAALPAALVLYVGALAMIAAVAPRLGADSDNEFWFATTLGGTLLLAMVVAFYLSLRCR